MRALDRYEIFLAVVVGFSGLAFLAMRTGKRRLPYPPGPSRLPIVGNLFTMPSREEWVTYRKWSEECGSDIIHADIMGSHVVILNSIKSANELLEKRSSIYSDRYDGLRPAGYIIDQSKRNPFSGHPLWRWSCTIKFYGFICRHILIIPNLVANSSFGMDFNTVFTSPGSAWRRSRRELHANLRPVDLESYQPLVQRAVHRLLGNLLSSPDNFRQHLRHMAGQAILSIAYGIDVLPENDPYVADAEKLGHALAVGSTKEATLLDAIPWLTKMPSWFPGARYKLYAQEIYPMVIGAVKTPYNRVRSDLSSGTATPSVAAKIISKLDENSTEEDLWVSWAVPGTMYMGTVDTTNSTLQTFILAMTLYPDVQRRAHAEIDHNVGNSRFAEISDEGALPYIQAVLKEVLRWHPVTPLAVPHRVTENDVYEGYYIPAGSTIIPNAWAMLHDPAVFPEPDRFYPERWLSPGAPAFPNQAFGFGARRCPGRNFARTSMWLTMAGILAAFDITPTEDGPPEEIYLSGFASYVKPFRCYIRPRSEAAASLVRTTESEG